MITQSKLKTAVIILAASTILTLRANAYGAAQAEHEHATGTAPALRLKWGPACG